MIMITLIKYNYYAVLNYCPLIIVHVHTCRFQFSLEQGIIMQDSTDFVSDTVLKHNNS